MSELFSPEMKPVYGTLAFVYGCLLGSFFNVCIYRIPLSQSINRPRRSFCFSCGTTIQWLDNIPLISYLALKGRCRKCGAPFSMRYFFVELLTGLLFLIVFLRFGYTLTTLVYIIFTSTLIIATFTDIDHWIIPDSMSLGGAAVGVVCAFLLPLAGSELTQGFGPAIFGPLPGDVWWGPGGNSILGAAFGYGLLWMVGFTGRLMFGKEAMGMGDLKLFASIGAFLGWINCLAVLMGASLIGTVLGAPMLFRQWTGGRRRKAAQKSATREKVAETNEQNDSPSPYDLATILSHTDSGDGGHHLPFGPSIAVAAFAVMIFQDAIHQYTGAITWSDFYIIYQMTFGR